MLCCKNIFAPGNDPVYYWELHTDLKKLFPNEKKYFI